MWDYRYSRKRYCIWVIALLLLKVGAIVAVQIDPKLLSIAGPVDNGIAVALAFVVGARFADAGWSRWLGIGLVILIYLVLPIIVVLPASLETAPASNPLDIMPPQLALVTVAILALLIVAGIPRSVAAVPAERFEPTA